MLPDIYKVKTIENGSISIMAMPVSGEWIEDEFNGIAKCGITCIVSLLEWQESIEVGLEKEQQLSEKYGMQFISFPIVDRGLPGSIQNYLKFTKGLYTKIVSGAHMVVHCRAGIGRTGIISAGILMHAGLSASESLKYISNKRGINVPDTQEQENWVLESYKAIQSEN